MTLFSGNQLIGVSPLSRRSSKGCESITQRHEGVWQPWLSKHRMIRSCTACAAVNCVLMVRSVSFVPRPKSWWCARVQSFRCVGRGAAALAPQCRLGIPTSAAAKAEISANSTANSASQCRSNPVSGRRLRKTGIIQRMAGDFRPFRSTVRKIGSVETGYRIAKGRRWRAFLRPVDLKPAAAALPGWRRSADRARLQVIFPANREFYREYRDFGFSGPVSVHETTVPQRFSAKFPTQVNREIISDNREFFCGNSEIVSVHFSHTFPVAR
jgi:hypothetical protein